MLLLITLATRTPAFCGCSLRLLLLLLILSKQAQLSGQHPRPRRQKIGRSNVERSLLSTLTLVDSSLACKANKYVMSGHCSAKSSHFELLYNSVTPVHSTLSGGSQAINKRYLLAYVLPSFLFYYHR
jgi:hypothetical protein